MQAIMVDRYNLRKGLQNHNFSSLLLEVELESVTGVLANPPHYKYCKRCFRWGQFCPECPTEDMVTDLREVFTKYRI